MFSSLLQLARREIAEWRRIANIRELGKLSDHQPDDIGLRREQLFMLDSLQPDQARERFFRAPDFQPGFEPCG